MDGVTEMRKASQLFRTNTELGSWDWVSDMSVKFLMAQFLIFTSLLWMLLFADVGLPWITDLMVRTIREDWAKQVNVGAELIPIFFLIWWLTILLVMWGMALVLLWEPTLFLAFQEWGRDDKAGTSQTRDAVAFGGGMLGATLFLFSVIAVFIKSG